MKKYNGKATVVKSGDVTTIRVVDYHGQPPKPSPTSSPPNTPSVNQEELEALKHIDIIAFSSAAEQEFLKILNYLCDEMPMGVPIVGLRAEVAYKLGVSTMTAKRYIEKYCYSFSAPFKVIADGKVIRKDNDDAIKD